LRLILGGLHNSEIFINIGRRNWDVSTGRAASEWSFHTINIGRWRNFYINTGRTPLERNFHVNIKEACIRPKFLRLTLEAHDGAD
jgi:hypothetical protein